MLYLKMKFGIVYSSEYPKTLNSSFFTEVTSKSHNFFQDLQKAQIFFVNVRNFSNLENLQYKIMKFYVEKSVSAIEHI